MGSTMSIDSMADDPASGHAWLATAGRIRRTEPGSDGRVAPTTLDPEQFQEHLRPAWHVVAATVVVLAAAVLVSWLRP